jgi:hypothetical protein
MIRYALFLVQSLLFGAEVGVVYWQPTPITVGLAVFVGCVTIHTLAAAVRDVA